MKFNVLFVNHPEKECGVHQFGENVYSAIKNSAHYEFIYCECKNQAELLEKITNHNPAIIIYNYYNSTMPWLNSGITRNIDIPHIGIIHEVTQERVNEANKTLFDFHIAPDPTLLLTNSIVFKTGRMIPEFDGRHFDPEILTIGSFGFGTKGKGYTRIIDVVQKEFDQAIIKFNIPFARFGDVTGTGAKAYAEACKKLIHKPGISLQVTHEFMSQEEVLSFLAANTINCFFYEENKNRGISSVTDMALAVNKPFAITKSTMFRNLATATPSIFIEDLPLKRIIENGITPLLPFKKEWTTTNLCWDYERICTAALKNYQKQPLWKSNFFSLIEKIPGMRLVKKFRKIATRSINRDKLMLAARQSRERKAEYGTYNFSSDRILFTETNYNRILDNIARTQYDDVIKLLCQLCPDEMSRKIPEANIQQAFVFETVRNLALKFNSPRILSIGCYEDTAWMGLKKIGYTVDGIDPVLNYDLTTFLGKPGVKDNKYDIIFSTSVIEHVENDNKFVEEIADLLNPGGFAILTCDYKKDYKPGDKIPNVDFRFYTETDLGSRLLSHMKGCSIYGVHQWNYQKPDFWFENINYTFATLVVQKNNCFAD